MGFVVNKATGNELVNWGSIRTSLDSADGFDLESEGNTAINHGSIVTMGAGGNGFNLHGGDNTGINHGTVVTTGRGAMGMFGGPDGNNTYENRGTIRVYGPSANAIRTFNDNNTVFNDSILISAQDDAIHFDRGAGNALTLADGSFIGGGVYLGNGATVGIANGPGHSIHWDFDGTMDGGPPTVNGPMQYFYDPASQRYATFDPTPLAGTVNQMGHVQALLSSVGRGGLEGTPPNGDTFLPWDGRIWATVFGADYDHDAAGVLLKRDIALRGAALGYTMRPADGLIVSAMAGALRGRQDADSWYTTSYRLNTDGIFAGLNGRYRHGRIEVDLGVVGGQTSYDSHRFINDNLAPLGEGSASAAYDGLFASPELGIGAVFDFGVLTIRPAIRAAYTMHKVDGYTEKGARSNASVGDRTLSMLSGSAEIVLRKRIFDYGMAHVTGGYVVRRTLGDDSVPIQLVGVTKDIDFGDTDSAALYMSAAA